MEANMRRLLVALVACLLLGGTAGTAKAFDIVGDIDLTVLAFEGMPFGITPFVNQMFSGSFSVVGIGGAPMTVAIEPVSFSAFDLTIGDATIDADSAQAGSVGLFDIVGAPGAMSCD